MYASTTTTWYKNDNILNNEGSINTFSCQINFNNEPQKLNKKNEIIYIVGHAYGSPSGDNPDLHHNLTEYFEQQDSLKDSYIVLTGDFVRNNNTKDFKMVKTYLENNFKDYLISVGNHEVINENNEISINNFNSVFDKDLYFLEVKDILFIAANFSNPNWEPSDIQKEIINEKINKAESKYIFLFSHQIFWKKE